MFKSTRKVFSHLSRLPEIVRCWRETSSWFQITLAYLGLKGLRFPYSLRLRTGERIVLQEHTDLVIFWLVFVRRHYPVQQSDGLIVDIGANIGLFTIYAAREAPACRIFAVEPFPDSCRRLQEHIHQNRMGERVTILNFAIDRERGFGSNRHTEPISQNLQRDNRATQH